MKNKLILFWEWLNTPFECLPWTQTLLVGLIGGILLGFAIGLFF